MSMPQFAARYLPTLSLAVDSLLISSSFAKESGLVRSSSATASASWSSPSACVSQAAAISAGGSMPRSSVASALNASGTEASSREATAASTRSSRSAARAQKSPAAAVVPAADVSDALPDVSLPAPPLHAVSSRTATETADAERQALRFRGIGRPCSPCRCPSRDARPPSRDGVATPGRVTESSRRARDRRCRAGRPRAVASAGGRARASFRQIRGRVWPTTWWARTQGGRDMAIDARMAKAFGLTGDAWQRHANPWSVYTRIPIPPLLAAAIWTRSRLGWRSLVPVEPGVHGGPRSIPGPSHPGVPGPLGVPLRPGRDLLGEPQGGSRYRRDIGWRRTCWRRSSAQPECRSSLRGGSWHGTAGWSRSACRCRWPASFRFLDRMALLYDEMTPAVPATDT